jgi:hypothetical protein
MARFVERKLALGGQSFDQVTANGRLGDVLA